MELFKKQQKLKSTARNILGGCQLFCREAWNSLGNMSPEEAMQGYVSELKKVGSIQC